MTERDSYRGVLLGLGCGDAVGRPVEGEGPDAIAAEYGSITGMLADGVFNAPAGTTTDDTALALALAESLVEAGGFDPAAFADRLVEWYRTDGFGVGRTTSRSIERLGDGEPWHEAGRAIWAGSDEGRAAGNGSAMRCAPVALAYHDLQDDHASLETVSAAQSVVTHADPRCVYGSVVVNLVIAAQLGRVADPLSWALDRVADAAPAPLVERLRTVPSVPDGDRFGLTPYVVDTLELALHHGLTASSTADAILGAVNEGGDADTTAAIAGAIAGARHGAASLSDEWVAALDRGERLRDAADALYENDFAAPVPDDLPELDVRTGHCPDCRADLRSRTGRFCPACGASLADE
jgi:ADP-ribosyl-[dinitrogen reductase] hydrolase